MMLKELWIEEPKEFEKTLLFLMNLENAMIENGKKFAGIVRVLDTKYGIVAILKSVCTAMDTV